MASDDTVKPRSPEDAWRDHNLSQLRYFRSLSLREKFEAVEGMADIVRHLERMRARGAFGPAAPEAREPQQKA
jgi:hypothetical protein